MKIVFIASIILFLIALVMDYRSSLGDYAEANKLVRGKDGKISKTKFFLYVAVALGFAAVAFFFAKSLVIGTIIMVLGAGAHLWAVAHNARVKRGEK
jgi:hypothetical protein